MEEFYLDFTCVDGTREQIEEQEDNKVEANVDEVEALIREFHSDDEWFTGKTNPYRNESYKTATHYIYCHSAIEYYFRYSY